MTSLEICGAGLKHAGWEDYAFAGYTQPLGSSWIVFARKADFSLRSKRQGLGFVEACLDTLHLVIARSPRRRGICCSPTFGQKQISRFARNDKGLGFVEAGLDTLLLVIPRSPEATRNLLFSNSW